MGNFEALIAEIARRRRNRWMISALGFNVGMFALVILSLSVGQA